MGRSTITLTCYHTHYCTISLSLAWFGGYLQRVTTRYRQFFWKNINIHFCCWCLWQQGISRICVVFLWIIIRQTCLGRYIISLFDYNGTLPGSVNMEVSPNIWNRNTFRTTNLYILRIHRQFQRWKLYNWVYLTVKLKLNSS